MLTLILFKEIMFVLYPNDRLLGRMVTSPLRWVGGKRRLLDRILPLVPKYEGSYYEPFVGGGSVMLTQLTTNDVNVNDVNSELINFYVTLRSNCEEVLNVYDTKFKNDEETFYKIRVWDRSSTFASIDPILRAARFLYLNKASFQGLWRVNSKKGYHNVPYSRPKSIVLDREKIVEFVNAISNVKFSSMDFEEFLSNVKNSDFAYLDPPYVPISKTSSFTGYTMGGFDHERLRNCCRLLNDRGVKFLLSNSDCEFVRELYREFDITSIDVKRNVAAKKSSRGTVSEVLVKNY